MNLKECEFVKNGAAEKLKVLLKYTVLDPNSKDIDEGHTPLSWAARKGYEKVVELLLGHSDIDPQHQGR